MNGGRGSYREEILVMLYWIIKNALSRRLARVIGHACLRHAGKIDYSTASFKSARQDIWIPSLDSIRRALKTRYLG
ncbi:unnamed protein product [Calypogeia fissa]